MRTTIDLPDDLHRILRSLARDRHESMSETVSQLLRRSLGASSEPTMEIDSGTGLPLIRVGRVITSEDVRSLEDEE